MGSVRRLAGDAGVRPAAKGGQVVHIRERRVSAVMAVYPREAPVVCHCHDCGLERQETVGSLIRDHGVGNLTPDELGKQLRCQRESCGGEVQVTIRRED